MFLSGSSMQTRFIGIKTAQSKKVFDLWEDFLRETDLARIIEIGTYKWGMSLYFFLWCKTKKAEFRTYDIRFFPATRVIRELGITKCFKMADVFAIEKDIGDLIARDGTTLVYCDGGNKPKELAVFSRWLKEGDYIATHDFGTEVMLEDIPEFLSPIACDDTTCILKYA